MNNLTPEVVQNNQISGKPILRQADNTETEFTKPTMSTRLEKILALPCAPRVRAILDELDTLKTREMDLRHELGRLITAVDPTPDVHRTIHHTSLIKPIRITKDKTATVISHSRRSTLVELTDEELAIIEETI